MRSDSVKKGITRAPHRSLLYAMGLTKEEIQKPIIGIANSINDIIPGHIHLKNISEAVKAGVRAAGGTPLEFNTIGICDGLAMGHTGMKYSLGSRELIADSIEAVTMATSSVWMMCLKLWGAFNPARFQRKSLIFSNTAPARGPGPVPDFTPQTQ
jgi:dihydroxyacid dehydratase/phosphogluconate dehydratase